MAANLTLWRRMKGIERAVVLISVSNFLAFVALGFVLGGTAFGGAQEGGRYYVGTKGRRLVEVTQATYRLSQVQGATMLITTLAGFVVGAVARGRETED